MKTSLLAAIATVAFAVPATAETLSDTFTSFYSFGDSLSDDGKFKPSAAPYVGGRATNGPTWAEIIEDQFIAEGKETDNLALSGAIAAGGNPDSEDPKEQLFTLAGQIAQFSENITDGENPGSNPLVSVWIGGNDLLADLLTFPSTQESLIATGIKAANDVFDGIVTISQINEQSFDDFVVPNLFNLANTPLAYGTPLEADGTVLTEAYNAQLATNIIALEALGLNVFSIDIASLADEVQTSPMEFGLSNVFEGCVSGMDSEGNNIFCSQDDASVIDEYLFIDGVHPTAVGHEIIADFATRQINSALVAAVPLPTGLPLLLGAIGALVYLRRRRYA